MFVMCSVVFFVRSFVCVFPLKTAQYRKPLTITLDEESRRMRSKSGSTCSDQKETNGGAKFRTGAQLLQAPLSAKFRAQPLNLIFRPGSLNPISRPKIPKPYFSVAAPSKQVGYVLIASGVFVALGLHVEMIETIVKSIESIIV